MIYMHKQCVRNGPSSIGARRPGPWNLNRRRFRSRPQHAQNGLFLSVHAVLPTSRKITAGAHAQQYALCEGCREKGMDGCVKVSRP